MKEKIALISILANVFLSVGKISVGIIANSSAIIAAGVDSFVDIFSSLISYVGIKLAQKPADKKHPYGHYKFEVISGVIITMIVLVSGFGIIYDAYNNFLSPKIVSISYLSIGIMIIAVLANALMSKLKIYHGKKENSYSLIADGIHSKIDIYTSLIILVGLFFTRYWIYTDALLALLMGAYIIKEAFIIGKEAVDSLLDVSAGEEMENRIKLIAEKQNITINSLKTQKKGSVITANLEVNLSSDLKVEEATKISARLREDLMKEIGNLTYVSIQIVSHEIETSFYKPNFGRSFGWQRKGRFQNEIKEAAGKGPVGYCICPKCGYKTEHQRGTPCSNMKCPNCNINLQRE